MVEAADIERDGDRSTWRAAWRGVCGRCPACGTGKLFRAFLKPVEHCASCGEALGHIRADDAPAWLSILITGHLVVPLLYMVQTNVVWPQWLSMTVWPLLVLVLALIILPRAKGGFIGAIWAMRTSGSERG